MITKKRDVLAMSENETNKTWSVEEPGEKDKASKIIGLLQDLDPAKATSLKEELAKAG